MSDEALRGQSVGVVGGGIGGLSAAAYLAAAGADVHTGVSVTGLEPLDDGVGVELGGDRYVHDRVVCNAPPAHVERELLPEGTVPRLGDYWESRTYGPAALLLYLGVEGSACVSEFADRFDQPGGSALGLAHTMRQTGPLRPGPRVRGTNRLYYVGGSANPGIGVPMCFSAANTARTRSRPTSPAARSTASRYSDGERGRKRSFTPKRRNRVISNKRRQDRNQSRKPYQLGWHINKFATLRSNAV